MSRVLRFCLLGGSIIVLWVVIKCILTNKIKIHYAVIWLLWGIGMVLMSLFPEFFYSLAYLIGIQVPVNAVFLILIFLLYCLTFYIYFVISRHNEDIVNLDYEIAALKKKIEDLERRNHD